MKLDKSTGGYFQVASGEAIPDLGALELVGAGPLSKSPLQITAVVTYGVQVLRAPKWAISQCQGSPFLILSAFL